MKNVFDLKENDLERCFRDSFICAIILKFRCNVLQFRFLV